MKKPSLFRTFTASLALGLTLIGSALADDVAVFDIRIGKDKNEQRFVLEMNDAAAPNTVANFKKLVRSNYYKGQAFHRAFPNQMVQVGDPLSRKKARHRVGTGGPGYTLPAEINRLKHVTGSVAMARLPDTVNPARVSNGSQFYITLVPMPNLDGQYTVFGKVLEGMEVLSTVSTQATDSNDNPLERVVITRTQLVDRSALEGLKPPKQVRKKKFLFF